MNNIVAELHGEKVDVIRYDEDPAEYIAQALSPADVIRVDVAEEGKNCRVWVPDGHGNGFVNFVNFFALSRQSIDKSMPGKYNSKQSKRKERQVCIAVMFITITICPAARIADLTY